MRTLLLLSLTLCACARPLPIARQDWVLGEVASRYHAFYNSGGDPDTKHDVGLLRPRFGLPAIVQAGKPFAVELLERGGPQTVAAALLDPAVALDDAQARACVAGTPVAGCYPLALGAPARSEIADGVARVVESAASPIAPPPGGYDLYLSSPVDLPQRVPRAVWLRADDPDQLAEVKVAHLTDLHVGKDRHDLEAHIRQVIEDVNALQPDLVVVTGDIANLGSHDEMMVRAQALLQTVTAPLVAILGNHDIGFDRDAFTAQRYGEGWPNFARSFHSFLYFQLSLGRFDFVGFDSGASGFSPRVLTRGLSKDTVENLRAEIAASREAGHRGVVLFSHAPSRAALVASSKDTAPGLFGQMREGSRAFESVMLDAAKTGYLVLHLAGHTHWSDVFESHADAGGKSGLQFHRWPHAQMCDSLTTIHGRACLITTQSASHSGLSSKDNAHGWGFAWLVLSDGDPQIAFHRYGLAKPSQP